MENERKKKFQDYLANKFDNDINKPENRGQEAAKRFMRQFSGKYITSILCPCKKDWNDVLRDKIQKGEFL